MTEPQNKQTIPKNQLQNWLSQLKDYDIYAPVKRDKYTEYGRITDVSQLDLKDRNTVLSPKGLILQQTKNMLKYNLNRTPPELEATIEDENNMNSNNENQKQLIFGIKPCDAHAFKSIDLTFDTEFKDPYYLALRNNTILVGIGCHEPDINCFCSSVDFNPMDGSTMDIMLVDIGESYLVNIYTEKGDQLVNSHQNLFSEPSPEQQKTCDNLCAQVLESSYRKMVTSGKPEILGKIFESDYWDEISRKCLGCGICTYLCPTCYCFDITDEKQGRKGVRVCTWDSCMYSEYTVHASGYNPRPARLNRLRNRVYHKFKYYPDLYKEFGCVGCGRCIRHCPVNIDIIDIVNGLPEPESGQITNQTKEGETQ
jgi:ferredoxin